jgi:hypothetical protein
MGVVGQRQPRQRVLLHRVGAALEHDGIGREGGDGGQDQALADRRHLAVVEPARHRQVQDIAAAILLQRAGEGPAAVLVHRDQERVGIARQPMLHPVGVMGVDIDIGDAAHARAAQRQDREHRIVEIAEPGRPVGKAVMRAAAGVIDHAGPRQQLPGQERGAGGGGGAAEHLGEDGVRHGPEPVPRAGSVADALLRSAVSSAVT